MIKARSGVTLIELIKVIVVVGALVGLFSLGVVEAVNLWRFLTFHNEIVSQGRMALARMGREIRQMPPRTPVFEPIQVANADSIEFDVMDLDEDGSIDRLEYNRDTGNNELKRIFKGNPDILATNVSNLGFTYYNKNNQIASGPSDVYRITITLTLTDGSQTFILSSQVFPRNLAYSY
jgi:hypothetical protein